MSEEESTSHLKVVPFTPRPNPYKESVIEALKEVLERAEAGDISAVAIATVKTNGAIAAVNSEGEYVGLVLGALDLAKYRILAALEGDDDCNDPDEPDDPDDGIPTAKKNAA